LIINIVTLLHSFNTYKTIEKFSANVQYFFIQIADGNKKIKIKKNNNLCSYQNSEKMITKMNASKIMLVEKGYSNR
jgi:hypothetical protein